MSTKTTNKTQKTTKVKTRKVNFQTLADNYFDSKSDENFQRLYEGIYYPLYNYIIEFVKGDDDTREVLSDVMETIVMKGDSYDKKKARFSTWIYTISRNKALGFLYHKNKWNYADSDISDFYSSSLPEDVKFADYKRSCHYINKNTGEDIKMTDVELLQKITQYIYDIINSNEDTGLRDCIEMYTTKKTVADIANERGLTLSEVRRNIQRGKNAVREAFETDKNAALYLELYRSL